MSGVNINDCVKQNNGKWLCFDTKTNKLVFVDISPCEIKDAEPQAVEMLFEKMAKRREI